jgi:N-acetylglucosamine-1-phosphodiester alpha-N-acetylglucosaminidase
LAPAISPTAYVVHEFINTTYNNTAYTGHLITIANPIGHYSIVPPVGGCGTVSNTTVTASKTGCIAASNAGFFDTTTYACIGNVVSNGIPIQLPCTSHANFGITKSNKALIGYMTSSQLQTVNSSDMILQLVQGQVWIVQNSADWVNASAAIEGVSSSFLLEAAPRVCIGHNSVGQIMVMEIDGNESLYQGPNLYQMAALALQFGFVNAVNLDGGGSSTIDWEGTLCSSCGILYDTCTGEPKAQGNDDDCQRAVTTINCFM